MQEPNENISKCKTYKDGMASRPVKGYVTLYRVVKDPKIPMLCPFQELYRVGSLKGNQKAI